MLSRRKCALAGGVIAALACSQAVLGAVNSTPLDKIAVHFKRLDINEDGFVDIQEVLDVDRTSFVSADSNKDGRLDRREFGQFLNKVVETLKKEQELSKEILLHLVTAGSKRPFPAANLGLID